jgi:hypothetical protein
MRYNQPSRKQVATSSTRNSPLTTKPMRGQLTPNGRPIRSGTDRYLAAAISGRLVAASSDRGSIQKAAVTVTSTSPVMPR